MFTPRSDTGGEVGEDGWIELWEAGPIEEEEGRGRWTGLREAGPVESGEEGVGELGAAGFCWADELGVAGFCWAEQFEGPIGEMRGTEAGEGERCAGSDMRGPVVVG